MFQPALEAHSALTPLAAPTIQMGNLQLREVRQPVLGRTVRRQEDPPRTTRCHSIAQTLCPSPGERHTLTPEHYTAALRVSGRPHPCQPWKSTHCGFRLHEVQVANGSLCQQKPRWPWPLRGGGGRLRGWCVLFLIRTGVPGDQSPCCRLPLCTSLCPTSVKSLLGQ